MEIFEKKEVACIEDREYLIAPFFEILQPFFACSSQSVISCSEKQDMVYFSL